LFDKFPSDSNYRFDTTERSGNKGARGREGVWMEDGDQEERINERKGTEEMKEIGGDFQTTFTFY